MNKKLIFILVSLSYLNAEIVITKDIIADSMMGGVTGQNDEAHEENCKREYKKLYERHSLQLKHVKLENRNLKVCCFND